METHMTDGTTRGQFLARAGIAGGGALAASFGLDPALAAAATSKGDIAILNYALTLEYLEAAFYTEAEAMGALSGELALFAQVVGEHERAHVKALKAVLGRKAVKQPKFNFRGTTEDAAKFAATAQVLEDTGVAAYKGQAPKLKSDALLEAALAIHAVEARHAGWIRDINGAPPAPAAFDEPRTKGQVLAAVAQTKFIVPRRRMSRQTSPSFAG
jgi:hypothetical protein